MSVAPSEPPAVRAVPSPAGQRRSARRIPDHSVEGVLARVLRDAMADDWNPVVGARRVLLHVQGDEELLRRARGRLRDARGDRVPLVRARAVASLNLALGSLLEEIPTT
jgi:hypothetical protein